MRATFASLFVAFVLSAEAWAMPLAISVGETKHVTLSQRVAQVSVADSSFVDVTQKGTQVTLVGRKTGRTLVQLTTVNGAEVTLELHVVTKGGRVFTLQESEESKLGARLARGERVVVIQRGQKKPAPGAASAAPETAEESSSSGAAAEPAAEPSFENAAEAMSAIEAELSGG